MKTELICHEMMLRDMFWRRVPLSPATYLQLIKSPTTLFYLLLVGLLLFGIDPHEYRAHLPVVLTIVIWPFALAVYVLAQGCVLFAFFIAQRRWPRLPCYLPAVSVASFFTSLTLSETTVQILSGGTYTPTIFQEFPFVALAAVVLDSIYILLVMPQICATLDARKEAAPRPPDLSHRPATLHLGGRNLRLSTIYHIVSEEHYVRVTMKHDVFIYRAKLAEVVNQTAPEDGVQPHRSWWVSAAAMPRLIREANGKPRLQLADGTRVPVAKARLREVQDWIDTHANWDDQLQAAE